MPSFKLIIVVILYLLTVIFGSIGIYKRKKIRGLINKLDKSVYLAEQLSYSQILLENYPQKFFSIEKTDKLFQRLKAALYVGIGIMLSFIYLIFENFDYTNILIVITFVIIVYIMYLHIQRKLFQMKKDMVKLISRKFDNLNKSILNKILDYTKETVDSYIYTFIAVIMIYVVIIILMSIS